MKTSVKALIGLGAITGGTLALLIAPEKGSITRKKLARSLRKIADGLNGHCSEEEKLRAAKALLSKQKEIIESRLTKIDQKLALSENPAAGNLDS